MARHKTRSRAMTLAPRRAGTIVIGGAKRAGRRVASEASAEKHRIGALIAAALLGLAEREGITIPHFGAIGEAGSIAIAAYFGRKFLPGELKRFASHLATAAGSIAIYEMAKNGFPGEHKAHGDNRFTSHNG